MEQPKKKSFTDNMRLWFKGILEPIANLFGKIGLTPTAITLTGVAGNFVAAVLIANGQLLWGGVLALLMGPLDALDGTMARLRGEASNWGAFVDSVSDRYSELIIFGGLLYYYALQSSMTSVIIVFAAVVGSVLVPYTKARAESLKFDANIGILTRMERYMILAPGLILGFYYPVILLAAVAIIALLANITAFQRIWKVRKQGHELLRQMKQNRP
jgi:CDP-diacylglycerol---glycerol-3-phosphate 3-phosphatidyltransferase